MTRSTLSDDSGLVISEEFAMRDMTGAMKPTVSGKAREPWEKPETVVLTLEDVESAADIDVVFASSCCAKCDID